VKTGLRTEIVTSVVLLLGAALLFAGFLLVKLAERELLDQQRLNLRQQARTFAAGLTVSAVTSGLPPILVNHPELLAWRLLDQQGTTLSSMAAAGGDADFSALPVVLPGDDMLESLAYSSTWNPFVEPPRNRLDLVVPLQSAGPAEVLQLSFSLQGLSERVHRAQRLVLIYVVLYGAVLTVFGVYLLNRNVVRPVRELGSATSAVAAGTLEPVPVPGGPSEIAALATSFNQMVAALGQSRAETDAHIRSLESANAALQQARNDLVRSEKLATVGHLAAGMAHEIGNPLAAVIGYLNVLQDDLDDAGNRDLVSRSLVETQRIDRLVRELLDYAAPGPVATERFEPAEVLRETVAMMRHQGAFDLLRIDDAGLTDCGPVCMSRDRLLQVFVNLLLNARDAMPAGGSLCLGAERVGGGVALEITDSGAGMPAASLMQIFEPFYTTKDPGKGRGLGLAVCQRIIDDAGGRISASSQPGTGTTFTVWLPLAPGENA